jgi:hypothetical protein
MNRLHISVDRMWEIGMIIEPTSSPETSILKRPERSHIPEDGIFIIVTAVKTLNPT